MSVLLSILVKITQGSLSIKIAILFMVGLIAMSPLMRDKSKALQSFQQSNWQIEQADDHGLLLIQKTELVRERNERRTSIVKDVVAGKLSKEVAAEQFMRLNLSEPVISEMLRARYPTSNDLECARKQLEQYLGVYETISRDDSQFKAKIWQAMSPPPHK